MMRKKMREFGHGKETQLKKMQRMSGFGHGKGMTKKMIDFGPGEVTQKKKPRASKTKTTIPGVRREHVKEQCDVEPPGGL
nr:uncharacterized protein LOC131771145 [Pocillopora verrucosa]